MNVIEGRCGEQGNTRNECNGLAKQPKDHQKTSKSRHHLAEGKREPSGEDMVVKGQPEMGSTPKEGG